MTAALATSDPALDAFAEEVGSTGPIAAEGSRTRWMVGGTPRPDVRTVRAPSGIVDIQPEEMTVRVRAGTPVAELHSALAAKGQRTALPERGGTVGGALAVGEDDHRALGRGRVRSSLLRVRYISAEGRLISGGGSTVKNVSGFDLPRLMVGSLGTLGLLAEVTLRTNPIPPVSVWLRSDDADPFAAFDSLLAPSAVLWDGETTLVQLEGHRPDVLAQHQALREIAEFDLTDAPPAPNGFRWSLTPAGLAAVDRSETGRYMAQIGVGTLHAENPQTAPPPSAGVQELHRRLKREFDPTDRLNPGRDPLAG